MTGSDPFLRALVELLRTGSPRDPDARAQALARSAPPEAAEIVEVVAAHHTWTPLRFREISTAEVDDFSGMFEVGAFGPATPGFFDPTRGLVLGTSAGGELAFGIAWPDGQLELVEADPENGHVLRFADGESFFRHVLADESQWCDRDDKPLPAALRRIFAAAGMPLPEAPPLPTPRLEPVTTNAPADPYALARAHFGAGNLVIQSRPSASGLVLLGRRGRHDGSGPAIVVHDGTRVCRAIAWTADVLSAAIVPGTDRALVCSGIPGPLVEIDLRDGRTRELAPLMRWRAGFVDREHVAVLGPELIEVHRWDPERPFTSPIATAPSPGFNIFADEGVVLARTRDFNGRSVVLLRWHDGRFADPITLEVTGNATPPSYFDASTRAANGTLRLAECDAERTRWFELVE